MAAKRRNCRQISPPSLIHMQSFHTNPPAMHPMKPSLLICALSMLLLTGAPRALAASFDCGKATGTTETLICRDAQTSALDDKLQQTYKTALRAVAPSSRRALIEEQRHWITYIRNVCQDKACLQQAYTARIAMLARNEKYIIDDSSCERPDDGNGCVNVVTYRDPSIRVTSFNQSIARQQPGGKIISCDRLINLPVGTANSNNSYGGLCTLQDGTQRKAVKICNDDMFGHFQMQAATPQDVSSRDLIGFTQSYCFGG